MTQSSAELVLIGGGASGRRFLARAVEHGLTQSYRIRAFDEHASARSVRGFANVVLERETVLAVDPSHRLVETASGRKVPYDALVLATGARSLPDASPLPLGCFTPRGPADQRAIECEAVRGQRAVVIGGGRRGLRVAEALGKSGLETHVVERATRLLPTWIDDTGAVILAARVAERGIEAHLGLALRDVVAENGRVRGARFSDGSEIACDLLIFCDRIRARDELGRMSGLRLGDREGIAIDEHCHSNDPDIYAIGRVASFRGHCLNWPAAEVMTAETAASTLAGEPATLHPLKPHARFRSAGVDVASFGDVTNAPDGAELSLFDGLGCRYGRVAVSADHEQLLGGILIGNVRPYPRLLDYYLTGRKLPKRRGDLVQLLTQRGPG